MQTEKQFNVTVGEQIVTLSFGKYAGQAGGALTIRQADTLLLATATMSDKAREGTDFFPLTVNYEERLYAAGRIPGSFFRREGRPSEDATLIARLTDRPIRPLFPKGMRNDVQIILYALSSDGSTPIDILAIIGASAALTVSDVPFEGPIGAVRVGRVENQFVINPTYEQLEESDLDLRIAGTRDAILMIECNADQVDEQTIVSAIEEGHRAILPIIELQEKIQSEIGKPKREFVVIGSIESAKISVAEWLGSQMDELLATPKDKREASSGFEELASQAVEALASEDLTENAIRGALSDIYKRDIRQLIIEKGTRIDGRTATEIRPLSSEVDLSPRAHGSGLFTRGETQVLTVATLGTPRERQELDGLGPNDTKKYMHHYNFPPFSVGETWFLRGASRRDIGHGALAERALIPVLPPEDDFPYAMRLVSEVLSSNGSTSMAAVCASTLALLDTGVPIQTAVAGIAMGLVKEGENYKVLTDIQGVEDQIGDMDFKVAGTDKGITALQMDIKLKGITPAIMSEALDQARVARLQILENINECMSSPRPELKEHTPRISIIHVAADKIGAIIGPGGKMVRSIQEETGVRIDIEDDGRVYVSASDGPSAKRAREIIESLIEEAEVGRIYTGKVVRITDFGAFVEILPSKDGLVHISQLDSVRVDKVEDIARVGEEITVMVTNIDSSGKIRLSRQAVLEGWTAEEAMARDRKPSRRPSGRDRGSRSGGRGSRPQNRNR
ncbi:MAG: polyribonucleotide nucleotidyltransferase [Chloroflexi bacterium]|nr:polyribonucleotide nucleotidyltransferase [Chloroflexota bacterium]